MHLHFYQELSQWPIVEPLPSYGQGIDLPGPRHRSLINGQNLIDVIITGSYNLLRHIRILFGCCLFWILNILVPGNNGTIDGQGSTWWNWLRSNKLNYSRPHLIEFVDSAEIMISNLTFLNSPAWSIHPVYCRYTNIFCEDIICSVLFCLMFETRIARLFTDMVLLFFPPAM